MPSTLTPTFFSDRISTIDNVTSAAIYHALQGANLLDLHDKLRADPRCVSGFIWPKLPEAENAMTPNLDDEARRYLWSPSSIDHGHADFG